MERKQQEPQSLPVRDGLPSTVRSRPSTSGDGVGSPTTDNTSINAKRVTISPTPSAASPEASGAKEVQRAKSHLGTVFPGHTTPWSKKLILTLGKVEIR
jgi:hypothetical protein